MGAYPKFTMSFSIGSSNKERIEAFELYQRAFKAKKLLESTPPDNDDIHIMMENYGQEILIGPGKSMGTGFQGALCCEVRYDKKEDFWEAYNEIGKEAQSYHTEGPYPWAAILGLVVDKFEIGWALYYNE